MAVDEELESRLFLSTFIMITNSQIARDPLALFCIAYLERDLAIFFSTSLSHDCVMFPIHVRPHT